MADTITPAKTMRHFINKRGEKDLDQTAGKKENKEIMRQSLL